jgi:hypothetical protein
MSTSTGDITIQLASARRALNARAARKLSKKRHGNCRKAGLSFQSGLSCRWCRFTIERARTLPGALSLAGLVMAMDTTW